MFGMNLITPQTGAEGKEVKRIYIENGSDIKKELKNEECVNNLNKQKLHQNM